jgi:hypothetical protein
MRTKLFPQLHFDHFVYLASTTSKSMVDDGIIALRSQLSGK